MAAGQSRYLLFSDPWAPLINLQQVIEWAGTEKAKAIGYARCDGSVVQLLSSQWKATETKVQLELV